jgi:hypothetical protein
MNADQEERIFYGDAEKSMMIDLLNSFLLTLVALGGFGSPADRLVTPPGCTVTCPAIVLKGRLADQVDVLECRAVSGMTCHITFRQGQVLPSHIFLQEVDSHQRPVTKRRALIYPNLKAGERGWASFRISLEHTVVLTGEWRGPWRNAY